MNLSKWKYQDGCCRFGDQIKWPIDVCLLPKDARVSIYHRKFLFLSVYVQLINYNEPFSSSYSMARILEKNDLWSRLNPGEVLVSISFKLFGKLQFFKHRVMSANRAYEKYGIDYRTKVQVRSYNLNRIIK